MKRVHWSEVTPQPFLRAPSREMLAEGGLLVIQSDAPRRSLTPHELRGQKEVIFDSTYVSAFFNNAFSRLGLPLLSHEHYQQHFEQGLNPLMPVEADNSQYNEYEAWYQEFCDLVATYVCLLPESGNGSRNPKDYPVRWQKAIELLSTLENLLKYEYKLKPMTDDELKERLKRL